MSVTDNSDLVGPLASLSNEETNSGPVTETVKGEASHELLPGECLLDGRRSFSFQSQQYPKTGIKRFVDFSMVKKLFTSLMGFHVGCVVFVKQLMYSYSSITKIFSATSTDWIGCHVRERHQQGWDNRL